MSISVWDDIESPEDYNHKRKLTQSLVATASLEPYLLASVSSDDFDNRVGMAEDRIQAVASEHGIDSGEIVEHFRRKASLVIEANAKTSASYEEWQKAWPPCPECGMNAAPGEPHEDHTPCTHPWCVENEPEHTKAEHIDPSHLDEGHEDYQSARRNIEDAFRGNDEAWLIHHQSEGPSKYSSRHKASRKQAVDMDRVMKEIRWRDPSGMENGGVPANISDADFMKYHQRALGDHETWARRTFGDEAWNRYRNSLWDQREASRRVTAMQRVAMVRQALEEGIDPLEWLVEETEARANNVGAEKPSEAGIEAVVGAPKGHQPSGS